MRPLLITLLLLFGCSTANFAYRSPGPYEGGRLIGSGTYFTEIYMGTPATPDANRFNGTMGRTPEGALFNAVAPSGKPLFRGRERDGEMETKAFATELPLTTAQLEAFYRAIRPLLTLYDKPDVKAVRERYPDGRPHVIESAPGEKLEIDEYDWDGHAFRLRAEGDGWRARLTLREYAIEPRQD
jgi:hypothetical protein